MLNEKNVIFALRFLNYLDAIQESYSLNVIFGKFSPRG
jgi:hypothetical protein